jgi:ribosome biogenesis protein BMS1
MECPADSLESMIDIAKIVDYVLLMIDGNYGFEMETMEFLAVLNAAGMPSNVFGILTHLDLFKKQDALKAQKKRLKHRFWSELYHGAKLFYLSGVSNGRYPDREILNLSRFLSVMKNPRPLIWRNSHSYCLADRFLDITQPTSIEENPKCDRTIALYGYLRGTNFPAEGARVHIPGVGDLSVSAIEALPDPCPTPYQNQAMEKITGKAKRRRLGEKQRIIFAPMSDVGGVLVDKDAVYIDVKTSTFDQDKDEERGLGEQMVVGLQGGRRLLGQRDGNMQLFSAPNGSSDMDDVDEPVDMGRSTKRNINTVDPDLDEDLQTDEGFESASEDEDEDEDDITSPDFNIASDNFFDGHGPKLKRKQQNRSDITEDFAFADSDSDIGSLSSVDEHHLEDSMQDEDEEEWDEDEEGALRWKENLATNAHYSNSRKQPYRIEELARMMYDIRLAPLEVLKKWRMDDEIKHNEKAERQHADEEFFKKTSNEGATFDLEDRIVPVFDYVNLERKWKDEDNLEILRQKFTKASLLTGANTERIMSDEDEEASNAFGDDDEGDGEFEDLETGEKFGGTAQQEQDEANNMEEERERNARKKEELKLRFEEEDKEGFGKNRSKETEQQDTTEDFGEDQWYEAQKAALQKQLDINRAEFDKMEEASRVRVEGYKAGTYARIVLEQVPYEFSAHFNPKYPIIIGGLTPTEDRFGFVQIRIKRHRWHKKILKTNDPLIFSLGWRRFQTLPIYSISDSRTRNRMLKYTPEHMHCFATFYGPLIAPNTGFCCVQSFSNKNPGFRIAANGNVLNVDQSTEIVKKLKLTGHPYKIFKNTAFIKDMFSSAVEIAKFEGASIRTVSGIRGQIKKALSKPEGHYRATFEDRILMSDIVFLRAWYPIKPHRFYHPVTNLLNAPGGDDKGSEEKQWKGMRLTGEVRRDLGIETPQQKDSAYRKIERQERHFNPLRVPRKVQAELPFKSQIVQLKPQRKQTYLQKRAVVATKEERKARQLIQQLQTLRNEKIEKRRQKQEERKQPYRKKVEENEEKRREREKREKEEYWRREGKKRRTSDSHEGSNKRRR